jgi:MFS superfamily sulfate permease-like transporter
MGQRKWKAMKSKIALYVRVFESLTFMFYAVFCFFTLESWNEKHSWVGTFELVTFILILITMGIQYIQLLVVFGAMFKNALCGKKKSKVKGEDKKREKLRKFEGKKAEYWANHPFLRFKFVPKPVQKPSGEKLDILQDS